MLIELIIANDPLDTSTWENVETDDLLKYLIERFGKWPENGRLYHKSVDTSNDVTPSCEEDIKYLETLDGLFYVVLYPGEITTILYVLVAAVAVAAIAFKPKIPNVAQRNNNSSSPNNELSARSNSARPNARIPDIFGTVRSTPDLICVPYSSFEGNKEVEVSVMCIGRGPHEIHDCKDGTTSLNQIEGSSASIFAPNVNAAVAAPYFAIGPAITGPVLKIVRNDAINGQTLDYPNFKQAVGNNDIQFSIIFPGQGNIRSVLGLFGPFVMGDVVTITNATQRDPTVLHNILRSQIVDNTSFRIHLDTAILPTYMAAGDSINMIDAILQTIILTANGLARQDINVNGVYVIDTITLTNDTDGDWAVIKLVNAAAVNSNWLLYQPLITTVDSQITFDINDASIQFNLDGVYTVLGASAFDITLDNPAAVSPDWNNIPGNVSSMMSPTISLDTILWTGPFVMDQSDTTTLISNFAATNGLYYDDGDYIRALAVECSLEVTPIDENDNPIGPPTEYRVVVNGDNFSTDSKGATLRAVFPVAARTSVRAARITPKIDSRVPGTIVDEIKWKDMYSAAEINNPNFGNVTIIRSRTVGTTGALSLKERKLNLLVTRQIPLRISGTNTFTTNPQSTNRGSEIFCAVALDPKIGGRVVSELDIDNIYDTIAAADDYFGTQNCSEFCYTFDEDGMTYEDTASVIASALFCTAYRRGSIIRFKLERETPDSTLLFNHRNKVPGSEVRTFRFGPNNDNDGIAYSYVSPIDDAVITYYIPADRTAQKEKQIESIGIRNDQQAYIQAWRAYNKLFYQNTVSEFDATEESELMVIGDRILNADNTRPDTQDGEINGQLGLLVQTSQELKFETGATYTMFLQLFDGTVQGIPARKVTGDEKAAALQFPPQIPLVIEDRMYAKTVYTLVKDGSSRQSAFLVTDRASKDGSISTVTAINYDDRYYEHDKDFAPDPSGQWLETLGSLVLWLDGNNTNSIILSLGKVSQWNDRSEKLNNAFQSIPRLQPVIQSGVPIAPQSIQIVDELV